MPALSDPAGVDVDRDVDPRESAAGDPAAPVAASTPRLNAKRPRGRFALELDATRGSHAAEAVRQRARAERAEAALAELRRDSARAILGVRRRAMFWRLVAQGVPAPEAAARAGLTAPPDPDADPPGDR